MHSNSNGQLTMLVLMLLFLLISQASSRWKKRRADKELYECLNCQWYFFDSAAKARGQPCRACGGRVLPISTE